MNNKLGKIFCTMLLGFCVFSALSVSAVLPGGNFTDSDIESVRDNLSSKGIILGRFIANGGNGDVYEATQSDKKFAIKISKTDADALVSEQLLKSPIKYAATSANAEAWLEECCVLPKRIDTEVGTSIHICSMPLAECDLVKKPDKDNIKYDYRDIADIIKNVVKGFEALRVRGFYHNDISLGNILKMPEVTPSGSYRLSDFGAMRQVESEDEGRRIISQNIKSLVGMLNGPGFSKGNPRNASLEQKEASKSFIKFCQYIKGESQISAYDVLNHDYIINYSRG